MTQSPVAFDRSYTPLTDAEKRRAGALLSTVSTRTLLHTLARLMRENGDAQLIISALLDRFPTEERGPFG